MTTAHDRLGPATGPIDGALLAALPAAVFTVDARGGLTFWNEAAERLWGRRPTHGESGFGDGWQWPDGRAIDGAAGPLAPCLRGEEGGAAIEVVRARPDGSGAPWMLYPRALRDGAGTITGALALLVDISERASAEVDRERLASIVSSSNDAIVSKTLDGTITSWNDGARRIFGYRAEEIVGEPITRLIPPELHAEEEDILARLRRGERIEHFETVRITRDGRRIDISLTVSPLRDGRGRVVGASKVARDVTERKRAEEVQRLLFDELNHRVKNTLATIQAIAAQSLRRTPDPARFVPSFSGRVQALARAHDLLVAGELRGADLAGLVREQVLLGAADARVRVAGPEVTLDPRSAVQLALVLHELATNARKHGALAVAGGRLAIEWSLAIDRGPQLVLAWQESGVPGVRAPDGQGFGTVLIRRSLEAAGGSARMVYGPDGLSCRLELPLPAATQATPGGAEAPAAAPAAPEPAPGSIAGRRILVVEDEPLVAMDLEALLEAAGCRVIGPAPSIERAQALIAAELPDAALLDANLGGAPVDALADALAARGVPFAFATGYGREALPAAHRAAPVLAKPFAPATVVAVVAALVAAPRAD